MAKEKWETVHRGIRIKKHPTRKHGIKPDVYFATQFQFNGKRKSSGLGWATEGWTLNKAIIRLNELKEEAREGKGLKSHKDKQIEADTRRKELERQEQERKEQEAKDKTNLTTYFNDVYYPAISQEKKEAAYTREESLFRLWIKPVMGIKPIKEVTVFDLERLKKKMTKAGRAPRSVEYCLTTLGQIFRHAAKMGYFEGDIPTTQVKKPKYDNKRVRFLSRDEAHTLLAILQNASQGTYEKAILSLHCGLRAGEIFSLTWRHVDLEHGLITLMDTKSGRTRTVSMTKDVKAIFTHMEPGNKQDLVFPARGGGKSKQISKAFGRAVEKAGFNEGIDDRRDKVTFHTLRHTFASWLVMEGISLYEVKELLGHATLTMTERYSHLAPDRNRRAAATMEKVFQGTEDDHSNVVNLR